MQKENVRNSTLSIWKSVQTTKWWNDFFSSREVNESRLTGFVFVTMSPSRQSSCIMCIAPLTRDTADKEYLVIEMCSSLELEIVQPQLDTFRLNLFCSVQSSHPVFVRPSDASIHSIYRNCDVKPTQLCWLSSANIFASTPLQLYMSWSLS